MKKIFLLGILVVSGLSFGRDFEYREQINFKAIQNPVMENQEMLSRGREISIENQEKYADFHKQLSNMDRGENSQR